MQTFQYSLGNFQKVAPPGLKRLNSSTQVFKQRQLITRQKRVQIQIQQVLKTAPQKQSNVKTQQLDDSELQSTFEHRAWVVYGAGVMLGMVAVGVGKCSSLMEYTNCLIAFFAAYVLADAGTGFYHWGVDNYGGPDTPLFGRQIAAFQGHHKEPWTITRRQFCNNVHQVFKPASFLAGPLLLMSPFAPGWLDVWTGSMFIFACMSQQFHAWAHSKKSELHPVVIALQDANILIGRKSHGSHHRPPFINNYCIVSGWWNSAMDGPSPDKSIYRKLENFFYDKYGVEPRCWSEDQSQFQNLTYFEDGDTDN